MSGMFNHAPKGYKCPICGIVRGRFDDSGMMTKKEDVFYQGKWVTAFIGAKSWPKNSGNVVIVPNRHFENVYDIPVKLLCRIHQLSKKMAMALKRVYGCDGVSVRQHNEPAGNQDVFHYHLHVIPRWEGDRLYQRHDEILIAPVEERQKYADKLRKYFEEEK